MRILILSRDSSGLKPDSATAQRWRLLKDNKVELKVVIMSREIGDWKEDNLSLVSVGGRNALVRWWRMLRRASYELRATSYDLITAQDPFELGLIGWLVTRGKRVKLEIQDHGGFFDGEPADEPLWFWRSRLAWRLARRAKAIRTVSPKSLENLKAKGLGDKAYWLPIAADLRFANLPKRTEPGLMVSVGRLVSVKRFSLLLESLAELKKKVPEAKLAVIGDGPLRQSLQQQAKDLGLEAAVEFVGQTDPAPWLERAVVFVLLSSHEGWGVAAIEAALAGVPVVMSDTGCARWLEARGAARVIGRQEENPSAIASSLAESLRQENIQSLKIDQAFDAQQTAREQVGRWSAIINNDASKLMVICQAVDDDDALFGFFTAWLKEAAGEFTSLKVLALRVGKFSLPENVQVVPLREKGGRSKLKVICNLWRWSWRMRRDYDGVYIRGDVQYPVLAGWLWKFLGKKVVLFYAHYTSKTKWLKLASWLCDAVVTSVPAACHLKKAIPIGQGVDASRFKTIRRHEGTARLLVFGRVSPIKRVPWILQTISDTSSEVVKRVSVIGRATDPAEAERLKQIASKFGVVWEERDVANFVAPELYLRYDIFLNATPGSLDKTIVEAMLSGLVVIASTSAYGDFLPADLKWLNPADSNFGESVVKAVSLGTAERTAIGVRLRRIAVENHSQSQQIAKIKRIFNGCLVSRGVN